MTEPARPLRRDAERNRRLLLSTAGALMARRGLDVTHDEVAREAGVGVGTVYRRFPTRTDLVDAVFDQHIDQVVAIGERACAHADAWEGLRAFMEGHLELQAEDRGLSELLRGRGPDSRVVQRARDRITPVVDQLVRRAQTDGRLGPDVGADDFFLVQLMVCGVMDDTRSFDPQLWRRALAVALAGLHQHPPLPGTSPDGTVHGRLPLATGRSPVREGGEPAGAGGAPPT